MKQPRTIGGQLIANGTHAWDILESEQKDRRFKQWLTKMQQKLVKLGAKND